MRVKADADHLDLVDQMCDELGHDSLMEVITRIDTTVADVDFTKRLVMNLLQSLIGDGVLLVNGEWAEGNDTSKEGDEGPSYGVNLREQQIRAHEMDHNHNDPRW